MNDFSVEANGLTKYFGNYKAVDHVSLAVPTGSIYGVLGPNGAGKTTSLRMTLGIIDPDAGTSRLFGGQRPQSVRHRIGYLPEERGLYPGMKAREAIAFMGALRGLDWSEGRRRAAGFMTELGLERVIDEKIRKMSKGMAQMIQLIGSIVHAPDLIVLDEPFSGLDPVNQERLEMLVRRERDRGATILFSTHVMAHAERLCDRIAIIARSARRFEGTVDEARALLPMQVRYTPRTAGDPAALPRTFPPAPNCAAMPGILRFRTPMSNRCSRASPRAVMASPACRSAARRCTTPSSISSGRSTRDSTPMPPRTP